MKLAKYYDTSKTNITTAITLTLLLRSAGAAIFGILGDKYGRKWPMVFNMLVLGILQIASKCIARPRTWTNINARLSSNLLHDFQPVSWSQIVVRPVHGGRVW